MVAVLSSTLTLDHGMVGVGYHADMGLQFGDRIVVSSYFNWGNMYTRFAEKTIRKVLRLETRSFRRTDP